MHLLPGFNKFVQFLSVLKGRELGVRWIENLKPKINKDFEPKFRFLLRERVGMMKRNRVLILAEILVMGGIVVAFIAPLLVPAEESSEVELGQTIQVVVSD